MRRLGDVGERRIISEVILKYVTEGLGDDCATKEVVPGFNLVCTTDPVPPPSAHIIAHDTDLYWMGWLLVTINASDLAAAGASPSDFLAAIEAPVDFSLEEFERLLQGIHDSCRAQGLRFAGGNLKEGERIHAVGIAQGFCQNRLPLRRCGAEPGDVVLSIGSGGVFWRDVFAVLSGKSVEKKKSPLFSLVSKIEAMEAISKGSLVSASIDNSDVLIPTLKQMCQRSRVDVELDLEKLQFGEEYFGVTAERLWLGWGDWNVIVSAQASQLESITKLGRKFGIEVVEIGRIVRCGEAPTVYVCRGTQKHLAPRLESERFALDSWFGSGIEGYIRALREVELP